MVAKHRHRELGILLNFALWMFLMMVCSPSMAQDEETYIKEAVTIPVREGLRLKGEILLPKQRLQSSTPAAILFLNPFGQTFSIYDAQTKLFADQGYIIVRYNPRGWHGSEGINTIDYDKLTQDAQDVVTWMIQTYGIGEKQIGVTGISEGAGLALLLSAVEPRLGAVAALSAWTDFGHPSLGNTQRSTWSGILLGFLTAFGNPPKLIKDLQDQIKASPPGTTWKDLQLKISPIYKLKQINALGTPTLLSHNFDDTLFPVNEILDYYQGLELPKRLAVFPGFHAAAEIMHIQSQTEGPWHEVRKWFTAHLLQKEGLEPESILFSLKNSFRTLEEADLYPSDLKIERFYVHQMASVPLLSSQDLSGEPMYLKGYPFHGGNIHTGTPIVSAFQNLKNRKTVHISLKNIRRPRALVALSEPLLVDRQIFGVPRLKLRFKSKERGLLIAHLLDVSPDNKAELITHGVHTWTKTEGGEVLLDIEALGVAWQLRAGHRLGLAFDTFDAEYAPPSLQPFPVEFSGQGGEIRLDLPLRPWDSEN